MCGYQENGYKATKKKHEPAKIHFRKQEKNVDDTSKCFQFNSTDYNEVPEMSLSYGADNYAKIVPDVLREMGKRWVCEHRSWINHNLIERRNMA